MAIEVAHRESRNVATNEFRSRRVCLKRKLASGINVETGPDGDAGASEAVRQTSCTTEQVDCFNHLLFHSVTIRSLQVARDDSHFTERWPTGDPDHAGGIIDAHNVNGRRHCRLRY